MFSRGIRPAVSPGLSVSRVGSAAQNKLIKNMAGTSKSELAQYREVEGFTKLGMVLDEATAHMVNRGSKLTSLLIQKRYSPLGIYEQLFLLYASLEGFLDVLDTEHMASFEKEFLYFFKNSIYYGPMSRAIKNTLNSPSIINFVVYYFIVNFQIYLSN